MSILSSDILLFYEQQVTISLGLGGVLFVTLFKNSCNGSEWLSGGSVFGVGSSGRNLKLLLFSLFNFRFTTSFCSSSLHITHHPLPDFEGIP